MNCVVTKHNFFKKLPKIKKSLSKADFIAIDTKFTGIPSITQRKQSSYVTAEEQYLSINEDINELLIIQFDITAFTFIKKENTYSACTYIFYLYRRYVPVLNSNLTFQYSALSSLCDLHFGFNKFFKEGITYLNEPEEKQLRYDLALYSVLPARKRSEGFYLSLNQDMQKVVDSVFISILLWLKSKRADPLVLNEIDYDNKLLCHLVIKEVNMRNNNVWASFDDSDKIVVIKVDDYERAKKETAVEKDSTFDNKFALCCVGFSNLFKFLTTLEKPIVGHDFFINLITMCNQFHKPLPNTYDEFKVILHSALPCIYDTRFISCELREEKVKHASVWESNELDHLYRYFKENDAIHANSYSPTIKLSEAFDESVPNVNMFIEKEQYKTSFQIGYCFIKMMHTLATHSNAISGAYDKLLTNKEHLAAVTQFKNRVYISLANISHVCLDGPDTEPDHYQWLLVKPTKDETVIDSSLLERDCNAACSCAIVRRISNNRALIGADSQAEMKRILEVMNTMQSYIATIYKGTESDSTTSAILWSSAFVAFLCSGIGAWILKLSRSKLQSS